MTEKPSPAGVATGGAAEASRGAIESLDTTSNRPALQAWPTIRVELCGTTIAAADGVQVNSVSPVCELARRLIAAGHDPDSRLECSRYHVSTGEHALALTGKLAWFADRHFTEGSQSVHARPYRPPDASSGPSQNAPPSLKYAFHGAVGPHHGAEHPAAPDAAVSGNFSDHESAENYRHVLVRISDGWRVSLCREPAQFLLQRRTGRTWQARAFCTTCTILIRECRGRVGPLSAEAESALEALPDHAAGLRRVDTTGGA